MYVGVVGAIALVAIAIILAVWVFWSVIGFRRKGKTTTIVPSSTDRGHRDLLGFSKLLEWVDRARRKKPR